MNKVVYIYQYNELNNGHSILDKRLSEALQRLYGNKYSAFQYNLKERKIVENVDVHSIDENDATVILSHFNIFKIAAGFKKSRVVFINHDLPYFAYFSSKNLLYLAKAFYSWVYIHRCWKFADFVFFISKIELNKSRKALKNSGHIKIGCKPGARITAFNNVSPEAIFTGNYKWSLKKKSLYHAFKNSYTGHIKLIAVNTDEIFNTIAGEVNLPLHYCQSLPETNTVRIGVITDDFLSGFKLKALELINLGCCIASFSDISKEFEDVTYYKLFIYTIKNLNELDGVYSRLEKEPDILNKFRLFYNDVGDKFNWDKSAAEIKNKLEHISN